MLRERYIDSVAGLDRLVSRDRKEPPEAQALVTGLLAPLSDGRVEVHARLADAGNFTVIVTVSVAVPKDWGEPPPPVPPRDYGGPACLAGAAAVATWLLVRAMNA